MKCVQVCAAALVLAVAATGCSSSNDHAAPPPPRGGQLVHPLPSARPETHAEREPAVASPSASPLPKPEGGAPVFDLASEALAGMKLAPESALPYSPAQFPVWTLVDGGPCDTRQFVLRESSVVPPDMMIGSCEVSSGVWISPYDGRRWSDPDDVAVDQVVPLREAWVSGADRWDVSSRQAFANDLNQQVPQLVVTADEVHEAKAGKDPAEWLPPVNQCGYAVVWTLTKQRWGLSVDAAERAVLASVLDQCG